MTKKAVLLAVKYRNAADPTAATEQKPAARSIADAALGPARRPKLKPATLEMVVAEVGAQFNAAAFALKHGGIHVNGRYRPPAQPEVSARTVAAALAANGFAFPEGAAK